MAQHVIFILFLFALGACIGSFLNVVVWRLPRGESLVSPPSHCPKCDRKLSWRDNIPVLGWLMLRGKCRYCRQPISPRYPIVELVTGLLFAFYYVMFFIMQIGPCPPVMTAIITESGELMLSPIVMTIQQHWPMYGLYMLTIAALLAASLIDAELFIIPIEIPWLLAGVGMIVHAIVDSPTLPGALSVGSIGASVAIGGGLGLLVSIVLFQLGIIKRSFEKGEPLLEVDREQLQREIEEARVAGEILDYKDQLPPSYTKAQIRAEIGKEMLFLLPPMLGAFAAIALHVGEAPILARDWVAGLLGAILGALVGAFTVWLTRILGTFAFGRVAMGLGDVHLMFGVGAVLGAGASVVIFFIAPFFGMLVGLYMLITRKKRELPYGPYLSLATAAMMLFYCPIADYLAPGLMGIMQIARARTGL